jgi:hypothetical protein
MRDYLRVVIWADRRYRGRRGYAVGGRFSRIEHAAAAVKYLGRRPVD